MNLTISRAGRGALEEPKSPSRNGCKVGPEVDLPLVALQGSPKVASAYLRRIQSFIRGLSIAAERGLARDDMVPGLRMIPFESVIIAVLVQESAVVILRVFHGS
jgi:plasmid stabilization system protein ParE